MKFSMTELLILVKFNLNLKQNECNGNQQHKYLQNSKSFSSQNLIAIVTFTEEYKLSFSDFNCQW